MMQKKKSLGERPPLLAEHVESPTVRKRSMNLPTKPPMLQDVTTPQDDEKMGVKVLATVGRFLTNTTSHGLPRIPKSRSYYGSLFWLFVWLLAAGVFLITAMQLYRRYANQAPATAVTVSVID